MSIVIRSAMRVKSLGQCSLSHLRMLGLCALAKPAGSRSLRTGEPKPECDLLRCGLRAGPTVRLPCAPTSRAVRLALILRHPDRLIHE